MTDEHSSRETFHCPHCGTETPVSDPDSPTLCPQCNREFVAARLETIPKPQPAGESRDLGEMPELSAGVELGGYRLEKEIGRGGMGIVFEAVQKSLGRKVAVKILPRKLVGDPEFVARFEREGLALAQLNHPNIVQIIDKGISGEVCFLVMEFVEGVSLRRVMEGGELTAEQALAIVPQICAALEYAHGRGVVHRDIKPENIMMDTDGSIKITDFGLARLVHGETPAALERLTRTNVMMGTPDYMAPEQREKAKEVDHRADIYSLGVIFYEMLTGELPLGRFPPPSKKVRIDVRLDEVVFKALEKEPELRYQRASEMHRDVTEVRESATPVARIADAPGPRLAAAGTAACRGVHAKYARQGGKQVRVDPDRNVRLERGRLSGLALAAFALAILPLVVVFLLILALFGNAFSDSSSHTRAEVVFGASMEDSSGGGRVRPEIRALIEGTGEVLGDSGAVAAMRPIAKRTDLSPAEQILLVEEAFDEIISDSSTVEILEVLIANPAFSKAASTYIAENIDELLASTSQQKILALLAAKKFPAEAGSSTEAPKPVTISTPSDSGTVEEPSGE
jgi:predicted Ser/Thr protein kinase